MLSPALPLSGPIPRPDPVPRPGPIPWPDPVPRSGPRGLAVTCGVGWGTALPVTKLRIASQCVNATVTPIRRHHPPVRALGRNLAAERFTLFALGHCQTCKTTHASEYRNGEDYLYHVPTSIRATYRKGTDPPMN